MVADAPKGLPSDSPQPKADVGERSWVLRPLVFASFALAALSVVFSALALLFAGEFYRRFAAPTISSANYVPISSTIPRFLSNPCKAWRLVGRLRKTAS